MGEATVPAEQSAPGQEARIPAPDVDASRARHHQGPPDQRPRPPVGISSRATFVALNRVRRVRRGKLSIAWLDDGAPPPPRVAYAIGRHVGGAVVRNRLRRRLRVLARQSSLAPGAYLVSAGQGAGEVPFATLATWWDEAVEAVAAVAA
jgi:ribonuclease P protein component